MRSQFLTAILVSGLALVSMAACRSGGNPAPAAEPPGASGGGTVAPPAPSVPPPSAPPAAPPTVAPMAAAPVAPPPPPPPPLSAAMAPGEPAPPPRAPASVVPAQTMAMAPAAPARPYQDVLRLKQAGLSDEFVLNKVRTENVNYGLTTNEILDLRSAGISETVIEAMLRSGQPAAAMAGTSVARRAEFPGIGRVTRGFMGIGAKTKNVGRLVVDGDTIAFTGAEDPDQNFSLFAKNVKEIFNTCVRKPGSNLCLEVGFVTYTGDEYKFRDPGWRNGDNRLVTDVTNYFRRAFPSLFFSERAVNEL